MMERMYGNDIYKAPSNIILLLPNGPMNTRMTSEMYPSRKARERYGRVIWVVIVLANAYAIVTLAMGED